MDRGQKTTVRSPSPVARRGRTKGVGQKKTAIRSPSPVMRRGRSKGVGQKKTAIRSPSPVVRRGRSKGVGQKKTAIHSLSPVRRGRSKGVGQKIVHMVGQLKFVGVSLNKPHTSKLAGGNSVTIVQPYVVMDVLKHVACVVKCSGWQTEGYWFKSSSKALFSPSFHCGYVLRLTNRRYQVRILPGTFFFLTYPPSTTYKLTA